MVTITRAFKIRPTKKSCATAAIYRGYDWLVDEKGNYRERIYKSNLTGLGFLELTVDAPFDLEKFECSNGQAPYLEVYLDEEQDEVLFNPNVSHKEQVGDLESLPDRYRVLFFLHFAAHRPGCSYEATTLNIPELIALPDELSAHAHYIPVG